jgi:hypothetical protein
VAAIEARHADLARRLSARDDRFSQLVSKSFDDTHSGTELITRSGLTPEEHAELASLAPAAHAAFQNEILESTSALRSALSRADPLYVLAILQATNLHAAPGTYYEPTHSGLESRIELAAGLLLTQPASAERTETGDRTMQVIVDEIDRLLDLALLRNLSAPHGEDSGQAELRFTGALHWMTLRGSSYEHHGRDLAVSLFRSFDAWSLEHYGFTIEDVLRVGKAAEEITTARHNDLLAEAHAFADGVAATLQDETFRRDLSDEQLARIDSAESREALRARALMEVFERGVRASVTFTAQDVAASGLSLERVEAVLRELSLSAGSLPNDDYSGLFDKNPLVERPFFEFDGRFLLAIPGMLLRDTVSVLESRYMRGLRNFKKARATTLDALAVEHLRALLPGSRGYTNLAYGEARRARHLRAHRLRRRREGDRAQRAGATWRR